MNFCVFLFVSLSLGFCNSAVLNGKVALVTGASRGIGKGIALSLAEAGATVYITGRSYGGKVTENVIGGSLEETADEINRLGGRSVPIACDHNKDDQVEMVFRRIENEQGRLDLLVNNAFQVPMRPDGQYDPELLFRDFWEQPGWFWDAFNNVGLRSHYITTCYAAKLLKDTKTNCPGSNPMIVHISSFGGVSYSFNVAYGVGKAGVDRMAKDMHRELKPYGIPCISLYPGVVRTERMAGMLSGGDWTNKTGLACPPALVESPRFSGRVIAALYEDNTKNHLILPQKSGQVIVAAEAAKLLGVVDVDGNLPPSIRSMKFLIPGLVLAKVKNASKEFEAALVKFAPDILLPMSVMEGGAPDQ